MTSNIHPMKYALYAITAFFAFTATGPAFTTPALADPLEISASQELIWDQNKGIYKAIGDASATRGPQAISADKLTAFYDSTGDDQEIQRILAENAVRFSDTDLSGKGAKLNYDIRTEFYELFGPDAEIISKDGTANATNKLSYDRKNGLLIAEKQGRIALADGRILEGDLLEITLDEAEEIQTIIATGDVYVRQSNGRQARGQEGTYDAATGKAILTGDVSIRDGDSVLNGQKAEIDFNKGISRLLAGDDKQRVSGILTESK